MSEHERIGKRLRAGEACTYDEATVTWDDVQEHGVYCERADCEECNDLRVEDGEEVVKP